jgi:hypothetical protein
MEEWITDQTSTTDHSGDGSTLLKQLFWRSEQLLPHIGCYVNFYTPPLPCHVQYSFSKKDA